MFTILFIVVLIAMADVVSSFTSGCSPQCRVSYFYKKETPLLYEAASTVDATATGTGTLSIKGRVSLSKPSIHYTVPNFKVGWQDEGGNWYDEDGPRDGPPQNYWRQSADEREYREAMDAVDSVLAEYDVLSTVEALEGRNSSRKPSLSRKVLGRWAPLLLSGRRVAFDDKPLDDRGEIEVPFVVDVSRSDGRRFGPRNHYGIFDLMLQNGEELSISTLGGISEESSDNVSARVFADEANESLDLGMAGEARLHFGGITYISDYLLIQRCPDGAIDFFFRADKSYLGASAEEMERFHLV